VSPADGGVQVLWTDVAPRDGLQSWGGGPVSLETKLRLVRGLLGAGLPRVEATALVSPRAVPQMADAEELLAALGPAPLPRLRVLVPNLRGLERALTHGVGNVVVTVGATESFNRRNVNRSIADSLADLGRIVAAAGAARCRVDVALSVCFGCPYEGRVGSGRVVELCARLLDLGVDEVGVADTIGVATPAAVRRLLGELKGTVPVGRLSCHFHDTRGLGVANVLTAFSAGVRRFDGSAGGIGGCPFAPRSTGNVCSEDALQALAAEGAEIGADLEACCAVSTRLAADLGVAELPGRLHRAGIWDPARAGLAAEAG
jgi:hydroxymethylglutaryl-CoA lyase